jgi:hypothetical protein
VAHHHHQRYCDEATREIPCPIAGREKDRPIQCFTCRIAEIFLAYLDNDLGRTRPARAPSFLLQNGSTEGGSQGRESQREEVPLITAFRYDARGSEGWRKESYDQDDALLGYENIIAMIVRDQYVGLIRGYMSIVD